MTTVAELQPGDELMGDVIGMRGTVITVVPQHPLFPGMSMVVWFLPCQRGVNRPTYSFDALSPRQELAGTVDTTNREANLRAAILRGTS